MPIQTHPPDEASGQVVLRTSLSLKKARENTEPIKGEFAVRLGVPTSYSHLNSLIYSSKTNTLLRLLPVCSLRMLRLSKSWINLMAVDIFISYKISYLQLGPLLRICGVGGCITLTP